jgi:hypothetical protein
LVTEVRIYFEGDPSLKPGFHSFFKTLREKAGEMRVHFSLIAAEGTPDRDFAIGKKNNPTAWNILLKDSEGPPPVNLDDSIFLMAEMMESWFHADKEKLAEFYGTGFQINSLKANPKVEEIPKKDIEDGLKAATKPTPKGDYHKTAHPPKLLERIRPDLVRKAAPNCERLFQRVLAKLA